MTTVFGETDFRSDGSYVTTQWFSIFMIPVVPLRSFRVLKSRHPLGGYRSCEETRLNLKQVASVYCYVAFCLSWLFCVPFLASEYLLDKPVWFFLGGLIAMITVPAIAPKLIRYRAKRRIRRVHQYHAPDVYRARA